jgi:hypothetical protein
MYTSYAVLRETDLGAFSPTALLFFVVLGCDFALVRQLCVAVLVDFVEFCTDLLFVADELFDAREAVEFLVFRDFSFFIAFCCISHSFSHL